MSVFGVDYAWGRPGPVALKAAGVKFACRYLSYDKTGKNLTRAEAEILSDAGIWLVVVWETTASRALSGRAGGESDAREAARQAAACGMPDDRPIYFAVDWDASSTQQATINAYLDGAASVIGRDRVGLYGGYGPVKRAFDAGKITYGWQTYAWSGGRWDSRAQLQQYSNDERINGVGLDYDRAVADDYGQWKVGETLVAFTKDDAKLLWNWDGIPAPNPSPDNPTWKPASALTELLKAAARIEAALAKPNDVQAIVQGVITGLKPEELAVEIANHLGPDVAKEVLDELRARLEG